MVAFGRIMLGTDVPPMSSKHDRMALVYADTESLMPHLRHLGRAVVARSESVNSRNDPDRARKTFAEAFVNLAAIPEDFNG